MGGVSLCPCCGRMAENRLPLLLSLVLLCVVVLGQAVINSSTMAGLHAVCLFCWLNQWPCIDSGCAAAANTQ